MLNRLFPALSFTGPTKTRPLPFLLILVQLIALYAVIYFYKLESGSGLRELLPWFTGGFIVHSFIPLRFRQAFFVLLTIAAMLFAIGPLVGILIAVTILAFVGVAHLPIQYRWRVLLILLMAAVLVLLRIQIIYAPRLTLIATIAGLFLMFRLLLYMHEIKHEKAKPSVWQRLSYFFMLPNLCFPLFPIVDYKNFLACQYNTDVEQIWRSGTRKILRGIVHLLLYRFIYSHIVPSPVNLHGPADFFFFVFTSYLLILRMSGIFYIAIGTLHLFGYNLPPIFDNFFLIPSFSEIWRRINIYWKEFVSKVFYYPIWFRLRKKKNINALFVTGMITFTITWQLHCWQWFWVLGRYPLSWIDLVYWLTLGSVITFNIIRNEKNPPKKTAESNWTFRTSVSLVARIAGLFFFMSLLWSLWNSKSFASWFYLLKHLSEGTAGEWLTLSGIFTAILLTGVFVHYLVLKLKINIDKPLPFNQTAVVTVLSAAILLLPVIPEIEKQIPNTANEILGSLRENKLNEYDKENSEQGYYEQLLEDPNRSNPWEVHVDKTGGRKGSEDMIVLTKNLLQRRLKPSSVTKVETNIVQVNRWGMRDQEYEKVKPAGTFRIVLLGGSYEMGVGVDNTETYESILENELNKLLVKNDSIRKIEILNFGVGGYHLVQQVWLCDHEVFDFNPDLVMYAAHSEDARRLNGFFASLIQNGVALEYPYLNKIKSEAELQQSMGRDEIRNRLLPWSDSLFHWGYSSIVANCRNHGAQPVWLYLPATADQANPTDLQHQEALARAAGFEPLILRDPYKNVNIRSIQVSESDSHPNAEGHQLIARAILSALQEQQWQVFRKLQFQNNIQP